MKKQRFTLKCCYSYKQIGSKIKRGIVVVVEWWTIDNFFKQTIASRKEIRKLYGIYGLKPGDVIRNITEIWP